MTKKEADLLAKALKKQFGGKTEYEPVDERGRYRFAITSKRFDTMPHLKRQDDIWELVDKVLAQSENGCFDDIGIFPGRFGGASIEIDAFLTFEN